MAETAVTVTKEKMLEYFSLNFVEAEKMFNLLQQAKKTIGAAGHRQTCGFHGCTCGAVEAFKSESIEFWRQVQAIESGWKPGQE
ncbi:MAG TPA: hypothetical protein VGP89_17880 [Candidatus Angelobacter sp.]|jgi:hypothetical protein|nr:hypothetical protein [Candidatus Angelobacter sp.]